MKKIFYCKKLAAYTVTPALPKICLPASKQEGMPNGRPPASSTVSKAKANVISPLNPMVPPFYPQEQDTMENWNLSPPAQVSQKSATAPIKIVTTPSQAIEMTRPFLERTKKERTTRDHRKAPSAKNQNKSFQASPADSKTKRRLSLASRSDPLPKQLKPRLEESQMNRLGSNTGNPSPPKKGLLNKINEEDQSPHQHKKAARLKSTRGNPTLEAHGITPNRTMPTKTMISTQATDHHTTPPTNKVQRAPLQNQPSLSTNTIKPQAVLSRISLLPPENKLPLENCSKNEIRFHDWETTRGKIASTTTKYKSTTDNQITQQTPLS